VCVQLTGTYLLTSAIWETASLALIDATFTASALNAVVLVEKESIFELNRKMNIQS
jgi:hypothetical protein